MANQDNRWNGDTRTGGDATKAAVSLTRAWRGYILCIYLDNDPKSDSVWSNVYDPYVHENWLGSEKVAFRTQPFLLESRMPPAVAYLNQSLIIVGADSGGHPFYAISEYPAAADSPDDFKSAIKLITQVPLNLAGIDVAARPALTTFQGKFVLLYRTTAGGINCSVGTLQGQTVNWGAAKSTAFSGQTVDGPSVTVFNGGLVCAATHSGNQIMLSTSSDGATWSALQATPAGSTYGPAIAADPTGRELMLYYANPGDKVLYTLDSADGKTWSAPGQCTGKTQNAPALLASSSGKMVAAYRGSDNDNLYYGTTKQGTYNVIPAYYPPVSVASTSDRLLEFQKLTPGQAIVSQSKNHRLIFQNDGNVVLYNDKNVPTWASRTNGRAGMAQFVMQNDGNLVLYDTRSDAIWNSQTSGHPGSYVVAQDDGNVVVYDSSNKALWSTQTAGK